MNPIPRVIKYISNEEYNFIHSYLRLKYGRAYKCENPLCESKSPYFQWAKRRGFKYELNEDNFIQLCCECHNKYDRKSYPTQMTHDMHEAIEKSLAGISFVDRFLSSKKFEFLQEKMILLEL